MAYDIYSAMGNRIRAQLVLCLSERPKNVTELINTCGLSQSAVSQHLAKLKKSGLVTAKRNGTAVTYALRFKRAATVSRLLRDLYREVS